MVNLEFSRLLQYLVTGEDESLVLGLLRGEPGAAGMLARAQATLQLLGPEKFNLPVRRRLEAAAEAVSAPPPMPSPPGSRSATRGPMERRSPRAGEARASRDMPAREHVVASWSRSASSASSASSAGSRPSKIGSRFAKAIRAGARQFERLDPLLLDLGAPQPIQPADFPGGAPDAESFTAGASQAPAFLAGDIIEFPGRDRQRRREKGEPEPYRVELPRGEALLLRHEVRNATDYLSVQLEGKRFARDPVQVTWLPEEGGACRVFTDASGEASLPWPAIGRGILRIDAARTLECEMTVRL